MQSFAAVVLIALSCAGTAAGTGSPVEKVVNLLKDMEANLKADGANEKALFEKFSCWCTGMTSKKGKAIDDAKDDLKQLGNDIMRLRGEIAKHSSDINDAAKDMKENHEAQQKATKARDLENAAFTALRGEMTQAIQSCSQALKMLNMAPQFLQTKSALSTEAAEAVRFAIDAIPSRQLGALPTGQISQLQKIGTALAQGKYDPSYGSLVTILEAINKQFNEDLDKETKSENKAKADFEDLMKTKVKELVKLQETVDKRQDQNAKAGADLAETTKTYDDTEDQMNADVKFFEDAVDQCEKKAKAWTIRQKMRTEELDGVQKAIEILTSDAARELFADAINAENRVARPNKAYSFLQVENMLPGQQEAFKVIKSFATKSQSVALARIAAQVRLAKGGHFTEVMKAIDKVVGVLKKEQEEDNKKKTQCNKEYKNIASESADLEWKIEKNEAEIDDLKTTIENKEAEKAATIESIKDTKQNIKDMDKQRKDEKQAYDSDKKDDEDAIKLINSAKDALQAFYKKHKLNNALGLFIQGDPDDVLRGDSAPKAKLSDKGSRGIESKGIVTLMKTIVEGLEDEIRVQTKVEEMAIADYKKSKKAAQDLQKSLEKKKTNLEKAIADRKKDKDDEEKDKKANEKDLKDEQDYKAKIKPDCDFIIDNWQDRYNKRKAEMDGLVTAKDFLAGAMSLAQTSRHSF